mmetsp:Transcript_50692/g.92942  ORF Transcript_50692/g.92942 Transcript_50692/m.92942 type:complete len:214 (-) Transcript_50692:105-746(-)
MATLQELLMQSCLDRKLPERVAELQLQEADKSRTEDLEDVGILEKWHTSKIQPRMLDFYRAQNAQNPHHVARRHGCQRDGHVLFCAKQQTEDIEQQVFRIVQQKTSLATAWYEGKHGLTYVSFWQERISRKGNRVPCDDSYVMRFFFNSDEVEAKVRFQSLAGRRAFEGNVQLCLALWPTLPEKVAELVKQFIPDYVDHLKQETKFLQTAPLW